MREKHPPGSLRRCWCFCSNSHPYKRMNFMCGRSRMAGAGVPWLKESTDNAQKRPCLCCHGKYSGHLEIGQCSAALMKGGSQSCYRTKSLSLTILVSRQLQSQTPRHPKVPPWALRAQLQVLPREGVRTLPITSRNHTHPCQSLQFYRKWPSTLLTHRQEPKPGH